MDAINTESDTVTPPQSPSVASPTRPATVTLHSSLNSMPTSPNAAGYLVNKSSSWSNLPLVSGSPRVEGIRIGNNNPANQNATVPNPANHETIRNMAGIPGYQAFTSALPKTTTSSPLKINLDPDSSINGPSNAPTPSSNQNPLSQSTGGLVTPSHTSANANQSSGHSSVNLGSGTPASGNNGAGTHASGNYGSGTWSSGGSGSYGTLSSGGSGNFNGFLNTLEDVDATPMLLKQGIVNALKGN